MYATIKSVSGREIIDSRGNPTIEVDIKLSDGSVGRAAVPSGASTGSLEAHELRDNDERFHGKGVKNAINFIHTEISDTIVGLNVFNQEEVDSSLITLDGTDNKSRIGANSILAVSLAVAKAAANSLSMPLYQYIGGINAYKTPVPMMNLINGGAHANNGISIQEFMIMPINFDSCSEAIRAGAEIFASLKNILKNEGHSIAVGDEGGVAPNLESAEQAIEYILEAIKSANYVAGEDVVLALDVAASEIYQDGKYHIKEKNLELNSDEMIDYYEELVNKYPIISIEDGLDESDHEGWKKLTDRLGDKTQLVGDDLFVTNPAILEQGIEQGMANSILIKLNQIGTLSETLEAINIAHDAGYTAVISHRSGETEDTTIAHIAVALNCGQIKTGSLSRTDRLAKYNELIRIEENLGERSYYSNML